MAAVLWSCCTIKLYYGVVVLRSCWLCYTPYFSLSDYSSELALHWSPPPPPPALHPRPSVSTQRPSTLLSPPDLPAPFFSTSILPTLFPTPSPSHFLYYAPPHTHMPLPLPQESALCGLMVLGGLAIGSDSVSVLMRP